MLPKLKPNFDWLDPAQWMPTRFQNGLLDAGFLQSLVRMYTEPEDYAAQLDFINDKVKDAAPDDRLGPLATVALYEILRQCAPAWMQSGYGFGKTLGGNCSRRSR